MRLLAIALALLGAFAMAYGAQYQNDAVKEDHKQRRGIKSALSLKQLLVLVRRPKWLTGVGILAIGALAQFASLALAPLIVVQPIGALALVISSVLHARSKGEKLTRGTIIAISTCVVGIAGFVTQAAGIADERRLTDADLIAVLSLLGVILVVLGFWYVQFGRHRSKAFTYILCAGLLYGFVATFAKVILQRVLGMDWAHLDREWLTLLCVAGSLTAGGIGAWFVQNAYASGPPDLVIAGLTVIDPIVAVSIAIVVLGEAQQATWPVYLSWLASGGAAVVGVYLLSLVHPDLKLKKPSLSRADLHARLRRPR